MRLILIAMSIDRRNRFHYRWEWRLRSSPEALWALVSDTNRFNRDAGVPAVRRRPEGEDLRNGRRRLGLIRMGVSVEWEEEPFEWVRPWRFGVVRRYSCGPVREMRVLAELEPHPSGGTRLIYQVWTWPNDALGRLAIPFQIGFLSRRRFDDAFRRYDYPPAELPPGPTSSASIQFASGGRERLEAARGSLLEGGGASDLITRLIDLLTKADDLSLARMRPYALADRWSASRRDTLILFLLATRAGLLEFQWDLLCPLCRGAKATVPHLQAIDPEVHCEVCHIDFTVNFHRLVELSFRLLPSVRRVAAQEYCIGGPQVTPHIVAQQLLSAGEERALTLPLEAGRYRLRALDLRGGLLLAAAAGGDEEWTFTACEEGWPEGEIIVSLRPTLRIVNETATERLFILERTAWSDQAATASEVLLLQTFRDLFSEEALRPGERIAVGSVTMLFTDLRGSTQLYREIGDAPAFGRVMDHFRLLIEAIVAQEGAIVKTIGDAVHGAFPRPVHAFRAAVEAQRALASPPEGMFPLRLKAGIHNGPCIAVTLNQRLDYFGSTVNLAARLPELSTGSDLILTAAAREDPEIAALLEETDRFEVSPFETTIRGFFDEPFTLFRVTPRS